MEFSVKPEAEEAQFAPTRRVHKMKKWKIAAAAACICILFTVAYAANAGSASDPLVTLSYLNTTFSKQASRASTVWSTIPCICLA